MDWLRACQWSTTHEGSRRGPLHRIPQSTPGTSTGLRTVPGLSDRVASNPVGCASGVCVAWFGTRKVLGNVADGHDCIHTRGPVLDPITFLMPDTVALDTLVPSPE